MILHALPPIVKMLRSAALLNLFEGFACTLQGALASGSQRIESFFGVGPVGNALCERCKLPRGGFGRCGRALVIRNLLLAHAEFRSEFLQASFRLRVLSSRA